MITACSSLPLPANGGISYTSGNSIGSVATYSCNSGFTLEGSSTRTCIVIGGSSTNWLGSAPNCIAIVGKLSSCPFIIGQLYLGGYLADFI